MVKQRIISKLRELTHHDYVELTERGNAAIKAAFSILDNNKRVLIPEEGGWLTYCTIPEQLGLVADKVKCNDAKINLSDLKKKLAKKIYSAFLYQNPGGYFAEQEIARIYRLCKENDCLVILDVSGGIGTKLGDGYYADILVGSFGKWKLIDAEKSGFISCQKEHLWKMLKDKVKVFDDGNILIKVLLKLEKLPERIGKLQLAKDTIVNDLKQYDLVYPHDLGFVVVVKYADDEEKERIIDYCKTNNLEWTECPRYIRLNKRAISIEVKRL